MAVKRWNGTSWEIYAGSDLAPVKVTDGRVGKTTFIGATTPTGMVDGDIWIDQDTATNAVVPTALLAKGDIFVATGNGAYTRMAAGNNGEQLYVDSSTSTGLRWQGDYSAGKNYLINGGFDIWQRGTTFTPPSGGQYTADRWIATNQNGTSTISRQLFPLNDSAVPNGYPQFFRFEQTAQATDYKPNMVQRIEDVRTLAGQTVTFSGYFKANKNAVVNLFVYLNIGSGGSMSVSPIVVNGVQLGTANSSSWQRFTHTFTFPSQASSTIGTNSNIEVYIQFPMNDTYAVLVSQVQLEVGSVATPFSRSGGTLQSELAACQRYYWRKETGIGVGGNVWEADAIGFGFHLTGSDARIGVSLPVAMRTSPSISVSNLRFGNYTGQTNVNSLGFQSSPTVPSGIIQVAANLSATFGGTAYTAGMVGHAGSVNGIAEFNAEL